FDNVTADNVVNAAEAAGTVNLTGKVTGEFTTGDVVSAVVNGKTYTAAVAANGSFSMTVSGAELVADADKKFEYSFVARDAAGNASTIAASKTYSVDTTGPSNIDPSKDDPKNPPAGKAAVVMDAVTADNVVNAVEAGGNVTVSGTAYGDYTVGDSVTLKINGTAYQATVGAGGKFSVSVKGTDLSADADKSIDVSLTAHDAAGNVGTITGAKAYAVDTTGPSNVTLTFDNVTADNVVNAAEAAGTVNLTGKVTGEFVAGDMVSLVVNGVTSTGAVKADGTYTVAVKGSDLVADADKKIDATFVARDSAGNASTFTASKAYGVDTVAASPVINGYWDNWNGSPAPSPLTRRGTGHTLTTPSLTARSAGSTIGRWDTTTILSTNCRTTHTARLTSLMLKIKLTPPSITCMTVPLIFLSVLFACGITYVLDSGKPV
ncbi:MAG: Ig-like domain-containing protein, partial [Limnohabitans sp.]